VTHSLLPRCYQSIPNHVPPVLAIWDIVGHDGIGAERIGSQRVTGEVGGMSKPQFPFSGPRQDVGRFRRSGPAQSCASVANSEPLAERRRRRIEPAEVIRRPFAGSPTAGVLALDGLPGTSPACASCSKATGSRA